MRQIFVAFSEKFKLRLLPKYLAKPLISLSVIKTFDNLFLEKQFSEEKNHFLVPPKQIIKRFDH